MLPTTNTLSENGLELFELLTNFFHVFFLMAASRFYMKRDKEGKDNKRVAFTSCHGFSCFKSKVSRI